MNVKIALFDKGLLADYFIDKVNEDTFHATLRSYTAETKPPSYIKFYKTETGWQSALEDVELVRELGMAFEAGR